MLTLIFNEYILRLSNIDIQPGAEMGQIVWNLDRFPSMAALINH